MNINLNKLMHTSIIFFIIISLLHSKILAEFIWVLPELFGDINTPINWLECHNLGVNLITLDKIDCGTGKNITQFNYGYIFLYTPYNEILNDFYRNILPWILIFLFIFLTVIIISPKNYTEYLVLYLSLINPSSLLLLERMQLDCLIYIIIIIIIYNKYYPANWLLGTILTLTKYYPVATLLSIFIEKKNRSIKTIFFIIIFVFIIFVLIISTNFSEYKFLIKNMLPGKPGYHYLYSLNSIPKIFKYVFDIKYQLLLLIFYFLFFFATFKTVKKINYIKEFIIKDLYSIKSKLFVIGGFLSLMLFVLVSNYVYKEIFIILLLPYLLRLRKSNEGFLKILIYLLIIRYLYLYFYGYINIHDDITHINGVRVFSNKFLFVIFIKSILDYIFMVFITSLLYLKVKLYVFEILKSNKIN